MIFMIRFLLVGILSFTVIGSFSQKMINYSSTNPCYSIAFEKDQIWIGGDNATVRVFGSSGNFINSYIVPNIASSDWKIYSMLFDNNNKWFGTSSGVKLFNGIEWKDYSEIGSYGNVNAITKDNKGNIWIATTSGISKFNGTDWTGYQKMNIRCITVDKNGNIWCGSNSSGVYIFDGKTWTRPTNLVNPVSSIACDNDGHIWCGTNDGVSMFDGVKWTSYNKNNGLVDNYVKSIAVDKNNCKWIGTSYGISKFDDKTWTSYQAKDGLLNNTINNVFVDSIGNIWANVEMAGLMKFESGKWNSLTVLSNNIYKIAIDSKGNKWFATNYGLSKYDGKHWTNYNASSGMFTNQITSVAIDINDNVWVGSYYGVSKFDGVNWTNYGMMDGLVDDHVFSVTCDKQGITWVGTAKGLSKFDGKNWTTFFGEGGIGIYYIGIDKDGIMWIGSNGAAYRFDGTNLLKIANDYVGAVAFDNNGNTWLGTWFKGVFKYDGSQLEKFEYSNGYPGDRGNAIYNDKTDTLWFGSNMGISKYDGKNWVDYSQILNTGEVNAIASDSTNILWIATPNYGVFKYYINRDANISSSENLTYDGFNIYPNPTSDFVYFKNIENIKEVIITSIEGDVVKHLAKVYNDRINISDLPKGMYIIAIKNDNNTHSSKIVKI